LNLAYRWLCRLVLEGTTPDHSIVLQEPALPSGGCRCWFSRDVNRQNGVPGHATLDWFKIEVARTAFYARYTKDLVEIQHNIIVDVEPTPPHRTAVVESTLAMLER